MFRLTIQLDKSHHSPTGTSSHSIVATSFTSRHNFCKFTRFRKRISCDAALQPSSLVQDSHLPIWQLRRRQDLEPLLGFLSVGFFRRSGSYFQKPYTTITFNVLKLALIFDTLRLSYFMEFASVWTGFSFPRAATFSLYSSQLDTTLFAVLRCL